ncbi:MAG: ankyrin repeat domain-containing protein [Thermoanaerobaculia bacterium]|nr:ankyrin repeat domain-containing protein [Thermoanaerobaculia bacterium]
MSGIYSRIVVAHQDAERIREFRSWFSPPHEIPSQYGEHYIEDSVVFDNAIIAHLMGDDPLERGGLFDTLASTDPDWLLLECSDSQTGGKALRCFEKGKKTSKKVLLEGVRKMSPAVDLYYAVVNQEAERLGELVAQDSTNLNQTIDGAPLLLHLLKTGDVGLLESAIARGVDVNARVQEPRDVKIETEDEYLSFELTPGMTMLHVAIELGAEPIVEFLLGCGLDVNLVDTKGRTPVSLAAEHRRLGRHSFVEPLVRAGANINHEAHDGSFPLFHLLSYYDLDVEEIIQLAEIWIELGADIGHVGKDGTNAYWAAMQRTPKLIEFVEARGIHDYRVPDGFYDDLSLKEKLSLAVEHNDIKTFTEFFDGEAVDRREQADLLHRAAKAGRKQMIDHMIEQGVPPYLQDREEDEEFAYETAEYWEHHDLAEYLKETMADFEAKAKSCIERVQPLYDRLIGVLASIGQKPHGSRDIAPLEVFSQHPFYSTTKADRLEYLSTCAVAPDGSEVQTRVNDLFEVTFSRPSSPWGGALEVTITTTGEPQIIKIESRP